MNKYMYMLHACIVKAEKVTGFIGVLFCLLLLLSCCHWWLRVVLDPRSQITLSWGLEGKQDLSFLSVPGLGTPLFAPMSSFGLS